MQENGSCTWLPPMNGAKPTLKQRAIMLAEKNALNRR